MILDFLRASGVFYSMKTMFITSFLVMSFLEGGRELIEIIINEPEDKPLK